MDDMPLFNAPPESEGPYVLKVSGAGFSDSDVGWLHIWADAKHALHSLQDRHAVMRDLGFDPEKYELHRPAPIMKRPNGSTRTCWYCWPLDKPKPWLESQGETKE